MDCPNCHIPLEHKENDEKEWPDADYLRQWDVCSKCGYELEGERIPTKSYIQRKAEEKRLRALDVQIAKKIFGFEVVGEGCAIHVEGEWSIHLDSEPTGWACYAAMEPLFVEHCTCHRMRNEDYKEWYPDGEPTLGGHRASCLHVVPNYSSDARDCKLLLEKMQGWWAVGIWHVPPYSSYTWGWSVVFERTVWPPKWFQDPQAVTEPEPRSKHRVESHRKNTMEEAVVEAALLCLTDDEMTKEYNMKGVEETQDLH